MATRKKISWLATSASARSQTHVFPSSAPLRISPAAGVLSAEDVAAPFTWEPIASTPGGYFQITVLAFESDDTFVGFPVICSVIDNGEFTMPTEVIEAFTETTLEIETRFERVIERVNFIDNIVFHQRANLTA
ncbi:MAG: hypothetical protein AB8B87_26735 [Granulosicoccus sp.]